MFILNLPITNDVNVSSLSPYKNLSSYKNLFIRKNHTIISNKILFEPPTNLNEILINSKIENIQLCFKTTYFSGTNIAFYISKNMSRYNFDNVTWHDCPMSSPKIEIPWTYNIKTKILKLNLTNSITKLVQDNDKNYGFQILGLGKNININLFSSRTNIVPYIEINFDKLSPHHCNNSHKDISYIDAYIYNYKNSTLKISNKACIPFNATRLKNNIYICKKNSSIIINKAGTYIANWQLYLYGTSQIDTVKISLNHDKKLLSSYYFPSNINQITGSSIIEVGRKEALLGYDIFLYNNSSKEINTTGLGDIYLAPVNIPASIIIYAI